MSRSSLTDRLAFLVYLIALLTLVLVPFLWLISQSFKPSNEIMTTRPTFLPQSPTLEHYRVLFAVVPYTQFFRNSVWVSTISTLITVAIAALAGYAMARFSFRGRKAFGVLLLSSQMFPIVLIMIPLFLLFRDLRMLNDLSSLIVSYTAINVPFVAWLLRGFFRAIPRELEDCALVDGCSRMSAFFRIVLPLAAPGLGAAAIFCFLRSWNEYLLATTFISSTLKRTLPSALGFMIGGETQPLQGPMNSASVLTTLPVVLVFIVLQRHLVRGLTAGAVKG